MSLKLSLCLAQMMMGAALSQGISLSFAIRAKNTLEQEAL
jgi:hypothetical protein